MLKGVMDSSASVRVIRRVVAGSTTCARVTAIAVRFRPRQRIVPGAGRRGEQEIRMAELRDTLMAGSRLMGVLDAAAVTATTAWRSAHLTRLLQPVLSLDRPEMIRAGAGIIVIAVVTHSVLLAALEVPVRAAGWVLRAGLAGASLIVWWRPEVLAAAWKDKAERRDSLR